MMTERRSVSRRMTATVLLCGAIFIQAAEAQTPPKTVRQWIDLPLGSTDRGNAHASDLQVLDVLVEVGAEDKIRFFYKTMGDETESTAPPFQLYPGKLRLMDITYPVPLLGTDNTAWPGANYVDQGEVVGWNDVLDPSTTNPVEARRQSRQSMVSARGTLFSPNTTKWTRPDVSVPATRQAWNGLAYLDATAPPPISFDSTVGELWTTEPTVEGIKAVPERSTITGTAAPTDPGRFLFVPNYCGTGNAQLKSGAGSLLVQLISNLTSVDKADRVVLEFYRFLADYTDDPTTPDGPLGPEVPSCYFWSLNPGACVEPLPAHNGGNKLRPVHTVWVDPEAPNNAGRLLLFLGLNLDPVQLEGDAQNGFSYPTNPRPLDGITPSTDPDCGAFTPGSNRGRDDGKYDYLAVVDITDMSRSASYPLPPDGSWPYLGAGYPYPNEWLQRTRFIRLPPDLPADWDMATNMPELQEGHDWSCVNVSDPDSLLPDFKAQIVGSGTPSAITSDPTGRYLYVVSVDQGQGDWPNDRTGHDGGWHVPHLYVIDLGVADLTNQGAIHTALDAGSLVTSYRFNKPVLHDFTSITWGWTNIDATIPDFPTGTGTVYPGENQCDPTTRTRIVAVNNPEMSLHPDRLYIAALGKVQNDPSAFFWRNAGSVFTLHLNDPTDPGKVPRYLNTITLPEVGVPDLNPYEVTGLSILPPSWIAEQSANPRNDLLLMLLNNKSVSLGQDRVLVVEEWEGP